MFTSPLRFCTFSPLLSNSVLCPMFFCNSQNLSLPKSFWQALRNSMSFGSCWRNLLRHNWEYEIQRNVVWPNSCWTLSKVSCSDTTVGANSGVSLASWRKKTCEITFCTDDLQNTWKNTVKIEKRCAVSRLPCEFQIEILTPETKML